MSNPNNTGEKRKFRRRKFRGKRSAKSMALTAMKMAKRIRRDDLKATELKFVDTTISNQAYDSSGTIFYLSGVATGTDYGSRIGRRINLHSILARLVVSPPALPITPSTPYNLRMIIFQDKDNDQTVPTVAEVLQSIGLPYAPFSPLFAANTMRFQVLCDRLYSVTEGQVVNDKCYVKMRNKRNIVNPIQYFSTGNSISSAGSGAIFVLWISSDSPAATLATWNIRIRYRDS